MRRSYVWILGAVSAASLVAGACSVGKGSSFNGDDEEGQGGTSQGGQGTGMGGFNPGETGGSGPGNNCTFQDATDHDGDGTSFQDGDCNDCDPNVNLAAVEVPTDASDPEAVASDENCNGEVDEAIPTCDSGLSASDPDPVKAAAALDLCEDGVTGLWGVTSAAWVRANGSPASNGSASGLLPTFGANAPRNGDSLLVISSGKARDESASDACGTMSCPSTGAGTPPAGFPQDVPGCEGGTTINDDVALEVHLKAPSNAIGYSFDFAFMSFEFPEWVCTTYNDQFIALVTPPPMDSINGNISFDSASNPVSVNVAYFDNCDASTAPSYAEFCNLFTPGSCPATPSPYCPLGPTFMNGTGFNAWGDSGSTGWLVTTAPIGAGEEFSIRFAIWDTGDANLDSTVMLDNFKWIGNGGTVEVGTLPVPE
jgi:hypothetical protein